MTPHQKIMRAAKRGTGTRLSSEEVFLLSMDDAVAMAAQNDDEEQSKRAEGSTLARGVDGHAAIPLLDSDQEANAAGATARLPLIRPTAGIKPGRARVEPSR